MVIVKADKDSESGVLPDEKILTEMGKFNEELVKAGVMLAAEGLHASSKGARVKFSGGKRTVIDGPFTETKELIAGFWLWQVKSKEEAIEWLKRAPFDGGTEVEIRQVFETADFAPSDPTGELRKKEQKLRETAGGSADSCGAPRLKVGEPRCSDPVFGNGFCFPSRDRQIVPKKNHGACRSHRLSFDA